MLIQGIQLLPEIKPEIKIVLYIIFIILLFILDNLTAYFVIFAILCIFLLRIPFEKLRSGWIIISLFLLFTFVSNLLNQHGRILFSSGPVVITAEGLNIALIRTMRVLFMIVGAKILIASTKTEDIVKALGRLLSPLEKLHLPVKDFFYTMGLTMRCFPTLKDMAYETYKEKTRTEDINGFWNKAKMVSMFLLPMFIKSIQSPETFFEKTETDEKQN